MVLVVLVVLVLVVLVVLVLVVVPELLGEFEIFGFLRVF